MLPRLRVNGGPFRDTTFTPVLMNATVRDYLKCTSPKNLPLYFNKVIYQRN